MLLHRTESVSKDAHFLLELAWWENDPLLLELPALLGHYVDQILDAFAHAEPLFCRGPPRIYVLRLDVYLSTKKKYLRFILSLPKGDRNILWLNQGLNSGRQTGNTLY